MLTHLVRHDDVEARIVERPRLVLRGHPKSIVPVDTGEASRESLSRILDESGPLNLFVGNVEPEGVDGHRPGGGAQVLSEIGHQLAAATSGVEEVDPRGTASYCLGRHNCE